MGLAACSPSPYYTGSKSLAPGAVPRDGLGRPVIDGEALAYDLPPPAPRISSDITGRPAASSNANRIIYFEDLRYSARPQRVADRSEDQTSESHYKMRTPLAVYCWKKKKT